MCHLQSFSASLCVRVEENYSNTNSKIGAENSFISPLPATCLGSIVRGSVVAGTTGWTSANHQTPVNAMVLYYKALLVWAIHYRPLFSRRARPFLWTCRDISLGRRQLRTVTGILSASGKQGDRKLYTCTQ